MKNLFIIYYLIFWCSFVYGQIPERKVIIKGDDYYYLYKQDSTLRFRMGNIAETTSQDNRIAGNPYEFYPYNKQSWYIENGSLYYLAYFGKFYGFSSMIISNSSLLESIALSDIATKNTKIDDTRLRYYANFFDRYVGSFNGEFYFDFDAGGKFQQLKSVLGNDDILGRSGIVKPKSPLNDTIKYDNPMVAFNYITLGEKGYLLFEEGSIYERVLEAPSAENKYTGGKNTLLSTIKDPDYANSILLINETEQTVSYISLEKWKACSTVQEAMQRATLINVISKQK